MTPEPESTELKFIIRRLSLDRFFFFPIAMPWYPFEETPSFGSRVGGETIGEDACG